MKKISLILFLFVLASSAYARNWFYVNANLSVTPNVVTASVSNNTGVPMACKGYLDGVTNTGGRVNQQFRFEELTGYGYAYAYIYATPPWRFRDAWGDVQCTSLNRYDLGCLQDEHQRCMYQCTRSGRSHYTCNSDRFCRSIRQMSSNHSRCGIL